MEKPKRKPAINPAKMIDACEEYIAFIESDNYHPDKVGDYENSIYEKAIEGVYGPGIFDFINSKTEQYYDV